MTDHTEAEYAKGIKVFIDLSDQFQALRKHLEENEAHCTADEVINHILGDQFYDMFDPHYAPDQIAEDWRFESLGSRYGTISLLIKNRMLTAIESYKNRTKDDLTRHECISFSGTHMDGVFITIGGSPNERAPDR